MERLKALIIILLIGFSLSPSFGQGKKVWISGAARGVIYGDDFENQSENDTTTARRLQSGHAMVDLGVNIQPSDRILIQSMVRIRNDYGGFWGSGVTFDVRQLYIQGIIGSFLKYQIGDLNLKLTPYTFQNSVPLVDKYEGVVTGVSLQQVQYDLFYYPDETWRQQGGALDFALEFRNIIEEMEFNLYTTRIRPTNFDTQDDRLYSGGSVIVKQSKNFKIGGQFSTLYDFSGTSNNTVFLRNPVYSLSAEYQKKLGSTKLNAALEAGQSTLRWEGDPLAPELNDFFYDVSVKGSWKHLGLDVKASFREVGPNFRSPGAQTMQINYQRAPLAYERYGNDQNLRQISTFDIYRDASLYNQQISEGLMSFDPRYDNATPYGVATPNRRGFNLLANYKEKRNKIGVTADASYLTQVVGEGTEALKSYLTTSGTVKFGLAEIIGLENRKFWISGTFGVQNTNRSGEQSFESVDLATQFQIVNLMFTLFGDLHLIGEYRVWGSNGFELVAERNLYSEIIDFQEYDIDYDETTMGAGLQYDFLENAKLRLMWQNFKWSDRKNLTQSYRINTWTVFFTMDF